MLTLRLDSRRGVGARSCALTINMGQNCRDVLRHSSRIARWRQEQVHDLLGRRTQYATVTGGRQVDRDAPPPRPACERAARLRDRTSRGRAGRATPRVTPPPARPAGSSRRIPSCRKKWRTCLTPKALEVPRAQGRLWHRRPTGRQAGDRMFAGAPAARPLADGLVRSPREPPRTFVSFVRLRPRKFEHASQCSAPLALIPPPTEANFGIKLGNHDSPVIFAGARDFRACT